MTKRSITQFLTSPSKVANALDWKKASGSILSLSILQDKIELAVSSHPSFEEPIMTLPSVPLKTQTVNNVKCLQSTVAQELERIAKDFNVCGIVVSWPVQKEGWCGAPCGRVLHTLDQLATLNNSSTLLHSKRPICLWDNEHHVPPEDEWGRAAIYGHVSEHNNHKDIHCASQEQYADHDTTTANVWGDFCRAHWPDLYFHPYNNNHNESSASAKRDDCLWGEGKKQGTFVTASADNNISWLHAIEGDSQSLNQARL